jgi:hypothetical protein
LTGGFDQLCAAGPHGNNAGKWVVEGAQMFRVAVLVFVTISLGFAQDRTRSQDPPAPATLWAGISIKTPIIERNTETVQVNFGVFNEGLSTANPNVESSHLFINGVQTKDWNVVIANGLRTEWFKQLPPGRWLSFGYNLGRYFQKPGVYRLRWESEDFKSAELTFRVVP